MCSDESGSSDAADQVARLARAIDDLAAADPGSLTAAEVAGRVARIWTLVGQLDPDLARRAAGYGPSRPHPADPPGPTPDGPPEPTADGPPGATPDGSPGPGPDALPGPAADGPPSADAGRQG